MKKLLLFVVAAIALSGQSATVVVLQDSESVALKAAYDAAQKAEKAHIAASEKYQLLQKEYAAKYGLGVDGIVIDKNFRTIQPFVDPYSKFGTLVYQQAPAYTFPDKCTIVYR